MPASPRSTAPGNGIVQRDAPPGGGDDLRDARRPSAPPRRRARARTPRRRTLPFACMHVRTATADDAEAIERIRVRGWRTAYRHVFPPSELDALPIDGSRWRERLARPAARLDDLRRERDGGVVGFAAVGPSRDERGGRRAVRHLRRPRQLVDRRRPCADAAAEDALAAAVRRGDALGARGQPARAALLRARRLGARRRPARRRSASACARPRCATARTLSSSSTVVGRSARSSRRLVGGHPPYVVDLVLRPRPRRPPSSGSSAPPSPAATS